MRRQNILRTFLFVVFFSIGAAVLSGAILCDDLLQYYHSRRVLKSAEASLSRLKSLSADYDVLLRQLGEDPNFVKRIAPATLGTEHAEANTVYPKATAEELAAARKALYQDMSDEVGKDALPVWLLRGTRPMFRTILFLAGAALILISFVCFSERLEPGRKK